MINFAFLVDSRLLIGKKNPHPSCKRGSLMSFVKLVLKPQTANVTSRSDDSNVD